MNHPPTRSRKGWWLTAGLLAAVAILGLRFVIPYYRVRAAIASIDQLGGVIIRDQRSGGEWFEKVFGKDAFSEFDNVHSVIFRTQIPADQYASLLERLAVYSNLKMLQIGPIHDDMKFLESFADLEGLVITHSRITAKGMAHIGRLNRLEGLGIWESEIESGAWQVLVEMKHLKSLQLKGNSFPVSAIAQLNKLSKLETLDLCGLNVTDDGVRQLRLKSLPQLRTLRLERTAVSKTLLDELRQEFPLLLLEF